MQEKKRRYSALVAKLKANPKRLLITILIGNNIVNLFTAAFATVLATDYLGSIGLGVATGATTLLILIFGEIIPKSIAYTHNETLARYSAPSIYLIYVIFYPVTSVLLSIDRVVHKVFRIEAIKGISEEEIRTMARLGVESGAIEYRERELIENIFKFDDVEVGDIMTPWYKVESLNETVPIEQIAYFVSQTGHSRFPVYAGNNTNNIVGYIHVNQIMRTLNSDERDRPLSDFILPVTSIAEHVKIERIFRSMKKEKTHLYVVHRTGDKSDLIGLVTLEDILEEIVGEIEDETDEIERLEEEREKLEEIKKNR